MIGQDNPIRIRKSLVAIDGSDERKAYFYCLKLFGVLPPPPGSGFDKWTFKTVPQFSGYKPKCLHDVLIASHSTSCQHGSNFFSFYHRHLVILSQIFLNFGHQILRGKFQRLGQAYPPSQQNFKDVQPFKSMKDFKFSETTQFDFLYLGENITKWGNVFTVYNSLKGIPEQIANHYWAPTNYLQDADLSIPAELAAKNTSDEAIDILFKSINNSYPWETNTERRWFNTKEQSDKNNLDNFPFNHNKQPPQPYTNQEKAFLNGNLDPRLHPDVYKDQDSPSEKITQPSFLTKYDDKNDSMVLNRTYNFYNSQVKNFRLNAIQPSQSIATYGGKSKNLQYITNEQKAQLEKDGHGGQWIHNYNMALPHYQYGVALYGGVEQFIEGKEKKGVQRSHNYMHNNFRYIMSDSNFSLSSLVFFPYHSWIDAMVEFKLRRGNDPSNSKQKKDYDYLFKMLNNNGSKFPSLYSSLFWSQLFTIAGQTTDMSKWHLSGSDDIPSDVGGRYPIIEWHKWYKLHKLQGDDGPYFSFAFCSRDYILTPTNIRDSFHFNEIYQSSEYVKLYKERYSFFKGLDQFNYNYNYQIGSDPKDQNTLLDQFATNIPKYLIDMEIDINGKKQPKNRSFQVALQTKREERKQVQAERLQGPRQQAKKQQISVKSLQLKTSESLSESEFQESIKLSMRKLFAGSVKLFASYPPNIKNGSNPIYLRLKNMENYSGQKQLSKKQLQDLKRYTSKGFKVEDLFIFGKQKNASNCSKCHENKDAFLNLDDDIRLRIPHIWKFLLLSSLNQVYYDSNNLDQRPNCIYNKVELVPNQKFTDYRLVSGAEEILINVETNIRTREAKFLRIDTEAYSVRANSVKVIASKKHSTFFTNFAFYKIFDLENQNQRVEFDEYVYKNLKGWVSVGEQRLNFNVRIPCFQRLLRLILRINRDNGKLRVELLDSDHQAKRAYYSSYKQ